MRHLLSSSSFTVLLFTAAIFAGRAAQADITPAFHGATPVEGGCEYSYTIGLAGSSRLNTGDYFTICDFHGYIPGSEFAPVDWTISVQAEGMTPFGVDMRAFGGDSPSVVNLTFTYTGAAPIYGHVEPIGGVGAFGAQSTQTEYGLGGYASSVHRLNPGHLDDNLPMPSGGYVETPAHTSLGGLTLNPSVVLGGHHAVGTVTLSGTAPPGGTEVALKSAQPGLVTVPRSVIVPEGKTSATFPISTKAVTQVSGVTVSGTYDGITKSAILKVRPR